MEVFFQQAPSCDDLVELIHPLFGRLRVNKLTLTFFVLIWRMSLQPAFTLTMIINLPVLLFP